MIIIGYLVEEVWEDGANAGNRRVATGCKGSRTGFRGQQNRCSFAELLDHLWAQKTDIILRDANQLALRDGNGNYVTASDERPNAQAVLNYWNAQDTASVRGASTNDPVSITAAINGFQEGGQQGVKPPNSFTGNINYGNIFAGATGFTNALENFGGNLQASKAEIARLRALPAGDPGRLTQVQEQRLHKFSVQLDIAAVYAGSLRKMDAMAARIHGMGRTQSLRSFMKPPLLDSDWDVHRVRPPPMTDHTGNAFNWGTFSWEEPDINKIISNARARNVPVAQIRTAVHAMLVDYSAQPGVRNHAAPLSAMSRTRQTLGCP